MNIEQYCSVCKAVLEMAVVSTAEGDDEGVVWLRCPRCQGYLPKISASLGAGAGSATYADAEEGTDSVVEAADSGTDEPLTPVPAADPPPPDPLADLDVTRAVPYRPWVVFAVGDVVHHLAWDDYGVVLAKETLPGQRRVVKVQFERAGVVRLIEESGDAP